MKRENHLQRVSLFHWSEFYAFQAGLVVVFFLLASLTNFGVSLLLCIAACTVARIRERSSVSAARGFLIDAFLLTLGLLSAVILSPLSGFVARSGTRAILTSVLSAFLLVFSKGILFLRSLRVLALQDMAFPSTERAFTVWEGLLLTGIVLLLILLTLCPFIVSGGWETVLTILRQQLIPWRI